LPSRELLDCPLAGIDATELPDFLERETGRVRTRWQGCALAGCVASAAREGTAKKTPNLPKL